MVKEGDFKVFAEYYDKFYLERKNYEKEASIIEKIIKKLEVNKTVMLLDVGCGTGEHLKYLASFFQCKGLDINKRMIEIAKNKVPQAEFRIANMIDFRLDDKFDVIICLFSSIGYTQSLPKLLKTLRNFFRHLNDDGLVIVEPWVFKKDFKKGHISLDTYVDDELKFVRMAKSRISSSMWLVFMYYLIGKNQKIEYSTEVHKMLALNYQDYVKVLKSAGFMDIRYLTENLWEGCRGLFVARKKIQGPNL